MYCNMYYIFSTMWFMCNVYYSRTFQCLYCSFRKGLLYVCNGCYSERLNLWSAVMFVTCNCFSYHDLYYIFWTVFSHGLYGFFILNDTLQAIGRVTKVGTEKKY